VAEAQGDLRLVTIDRDFPTLHTIDPLTGLAVSQQSGFIGINLNTAETVAGGAGLAKDPTTGTYYALLRMSAPNIRRLATIDLFTGDAISIGSADNGTGLSFSAITFASDGTLYGVTSDSSPSPSSLFVIDKTTGNATFVKALGNGGSGEAIVLNPGDNLIYHASGPEPVFETIDPALPSKPPANVGISVQSPAQAASLAYFRGDYFLWADVDETGQLGSLFLVKKNGSARFLSVLDHVASGMAFIGSPPTCPPTATLYGSAFQGPNGPALLYAVNPMTAAASMIGPIGFERVSGIAFRNDGTLFGAGERMDGSDARALITIDTCTGAGTKVGTPTGTTGLGTITDLSFRPPPPSGGTLFALATGSSDMRLATLNPASGAVVSNVGTSAPVPPGSTGNAIAFDPGGNNLFYADGFNLNTIDPASGMVTPGPALLFSPPGDNFPTLNALDFQPGTGILFASHNNGDPRTGPENYLSTVDTNTGAVSIVGGQTTQNGLDGIAFVPSAAAPGPADVQISNSGPISVVAGQPLTYTITVSLASAGTATGVFLNDQLPAALRNPVASTTQGSCSQGTFVLCNLGTIAFGSSVTITINANVVVSASGSITNTANVSSANDSVPGNNSSSATTTISAAPTTDLAVAAITHATSPDPTPVGKTLTFNTSVTNVGGSSAGNVNLYFTFSSRVSFVSGTAGCASTNLNIVCNLGTVASGQTKPVTITLAPSFARSVTATATVLSSTTTDTVPGNDTASATAQVRPRPFTRPSQGLRIP